MTGVERWSAARAADWLRRPASDDHKYRRGVLAARVGSARYPGAAVIGVSAAWRTGIGMVRYLPPFEDALPGLPPPAAAVLAQHPETVLGDGRHDAALVGSGTDPTARTAAEEAALRELLGGAEPVVVDAGALDLVPGLPAGGAPLILTPHAGEFERLQRGSGLAAAPPPARDPELRAARVRELAAHLGATVLLKGSMSVCADPDGRAVAHGPATPWLATAGTGDALAGILGALVASHAERVRADSGVLVELGATAALLHDAAARIAASDPEATGDGSPVTALDVVAAIPAAFRAVRDAAAA